MKIPRRLRMAGLIVTPLVIGGLVLGVLLVPQPDTAAAGLGNRLQEALAARGVPVETVEVSGTDANVEVTIRSDVWGVPASVWIRTLVERELSYLKSKGETAADWVTVRIVASDGTALFGTEQPVEPYSPPEPMSIETTKSDAIASYLDQQAQAAGVAVGNFEISQNGPDEVLALVLVVDTDERRDTEMRAVVKDLLPNMRKTVEQEEGIAVALYRISLQSSDGQPLVEYVVDATRSAVRAWTAEGVGPVWSDTQPYIGETTK